MGLDQSGQLQRLANQLAAQKSIHKAVEDQKGLVVAEFSPVNVGDEVVVNGFAFTGQKMKVDRVIFKKWLGGRWRFVAYGRILKKDGTLGERRGEWMSENINLPEADK